MLSATISENGELQQLQKTGQLGDFELKSARTDPIGYNLRLTGPSIDHVQISVISKTSRPVQTILTVNGCDISVRFFNGNLFLAVSFTAVIKCKQSVVQPVQAAPAPVVHVIMAAPSKQEEVRPVAPSPLTIDPNLPVSGALPKTTPLTIDPNLPVSGALPKTETPLKSAVPPPLPARPIGWRNSFRI